MKQKAFTLIELLVVIAIVGILSSVVYTNISGLRDKAKISAGTRFDSSTLHSIGDQLVGEWTFDTLSNVLLDTSGYANVTSTSSVASSPTYSSNGGYNNKGAFSFDGGDYITIQNSSNVSITGNLTLSAWVRSTSATEGRVIQKHAGSGDNNYAGYYMSFWNNSALFRVRGSGAEQTVTASHSYSGVWTHVAGTFNAGTKELKIYLNGVLQNTTVTTGTLDASASNLIIGARLYAGDLYFNGSIDDVRIYQSALSSSDMQKLYSEGKESHSVVLK